MTEHDKSTTHQAGAFDIRTFIALLVGIYGVVLVATGLIGTSDEALARADGLNINLWAGLGMVAVAAAFQVWAKLRPVRVPDETGVPDVEAAGQRTDAGHTGTK
jgi:hypothetical protein